MLYCSRHNKWVLAIASLNSFARSIGKQIDEKNLLAHDYHWKQLVLPGFDAIMGVR